MTRKDIETKYRFYGENKDITLYRKSGEFTYGTGYCGSISLKNGKAIFNGKAYSTLEDLDNALVEWEKGLPYPVDTYNPMFNERWRVQSRVIWFLTDKMGFQSTARDWSISYVKRLGSNAEISFRVEINRNDKVEIFSQYGEFYFRKEIDDADSGIDMITTIVNTTACEMGENLVELLSVCDDRVTSDIEAYMNTNENLFGIKPVSFKELIIDRLERVLAQLKAE